MLTAATLRAFIYFKIVSQKASHFPAGGILSSNPSENLLYWNAHHVLVPYCTSDIWSGTRRHGIPGSRFSFLGAKVVRQVILDLLPLGLSNASSLLLVGSSAGGTGVLLNLNSVHSLLHGELGLQHIAVRGMADSGWFLDREPYSVDQHAPLAADAIMLGVALWHGKVPPLCAAHYPFEPWRCFFGYRIYPFLTGVSHLQLFVFNFSRTYFLMAIFYYVPRYTYAKTSLDNTTINRT